MKMTVRHVAKTCAQVAMGLAAAASIGVSAARAEFPAKVFAPYMYLGQGDKYKLTKGEQDGGLKFYTLAFIIAKYGEEDGKHKDYPIPSWYGDVTMDKNYYADEINGIRAKGGDVICSFGGADGKELANIIEDDGKLLAAYQSIIDQYKFTWLDFDVEGNNLDKGKDAAQRRNRVIASLQKNNPGLMVTYTLPVDPAGLSKASQDVLRDAKEKGVKVHSANIMVMYFGDQYINKGKSEGDLGIESAKKAYEQTQAIDPSIQIGLCPCLGRNGSPKEVFTMADAVTLKAFADKTPWICSLHYWCINDDAKDHSGTAKKEHEGLSGAGTKPYAFAEVFKDFSK